MWKRAFTLYEGFYDGLYYILLKLRLVYITQLIIIFYSL